MPKPLRRLADFDDEVRLKKRAVRDARTALQEAARARARYVNQLEELGIELVEHGEEE